LAQHWNIDLNRGAPVPSGLIERSFPWRIDPSERFLGQASTACSLSAVPSDALAVFVPLEDWTVDVVIVRFAIGADRMSFEHVGRKALPFHFEPRFPSYDRATLQRWTL
jgi:hypothetical protein